MARIGGIPFFGGRGIFQFLIVGTISSSHGRLLFLVIIPLGKRKIPMWKTFFIATEIPGSASQGVALLICERLKTQGPVLFLVFRKREASHFQGHVSNHFGLAICIQVPVSGLGHTTAQLESECTPEGAGFQRCALGYRPWAMTLFETPLVVVCIYVHICTYIYCIYYIYIILYIYYIYYIYILYIIYIIYIIYIYILYV